MCSVQLHRYRLVFNHKAYLLLSTDWNADVTFSVRSEKPHKLAGCLIRLF